jgi:uncharacterized repeat protein (TIGR04076 family)
MAKIKVTVENIGGRCPRQMQVGDHFYLQDSKLSIPQGKSICIFALQSMMLLFPLLDERDRLGKDHWINMVEYCICPDPEGKVRYRMEIEESQN